MEFSSRMPRVKRFGTPKNNSKNQAYKNHNTCNLEYNGFDNLSHPEIRELQRYGTLNVNRKKVVEAICNNKAVVINEQEDAITALVRYSNRYYIAVMDKKIKVIKTFLPDSICNFLEYVQMFIDKENADVIQAA